MTSGEAAAQQDLPAGWDCHVHVFEAGAPVADGHYQPVHRPLADIEALARVHGVGHLVLVQPSVYGTDNRVLLDALKRSSGRHRAVVVVDNTLDEEAMRAMHAQGVRGVRFNLVSPVGNGAAAFQALAPRLRGLGRDGSACAHGRVGQAVGVVSVARAGALWRAAGHGRTPGATVRAAHGLGVGLAAHRIHGWPAAALCQPAGACDPSTGAGRRATCPMHRTLVVVPVKPGAK